MSFNMLKLLSLYSIFFLLFFQQICFAHSWMAPENAAKRENPNPLATESVEKGQALFSELCASCHGLTAVGIVKKDTGLSKDTPNLPNRLKTHTDGDFHWKIMNGRGDMPSFKDEISEDEAWNIINYIRSLSNT